MTWATQIQASEASSEPPKIQIPGPPASPQPSRTALQTAHTPPTPSQLTIPEQVQPWRTNEVKCDIKFSDFNHLLM